MGVDDTMPSMLWNIYWLDYQGCDIFQNIVFQDNKSYIILEKNVKDSSINCTNQISIRQYFVTYRIEKYYLSVELCPTADLIGDFTTKPSQVSAFKTTQGSVDVSH